MPAKKKTDLVSGSYTLPAPEGYTTVAVKIIDMLGEEVLVVLEARPNDLVRFSSLLIKNNRRPW